MKNITLYYILIATLILSSCGSKKEKNNENESLKPSNYTIVLDLSDRLLEPGHKI